MAALDSIRTEITELDRSLLKLLARRRFLSLEVAKNKLDNPKLVRDTPREQALLERLIETGKDLELPAHYILALYHIILEDSVLSQQAFLQKLLNPENNEAVVAAAFLGEKGSYSNEATRRYFSRFDGKLIEMGYPGFKEIFQAVENGIASYGVLPIENTSSGSIIPVYDLLLHSNLSIVGEITIKADHCILVKPGTKLEQVQALYAHPEPFKQCSKFLESLPAVSHHIVDDNGKGMKVVAELNNQQVAAIGSKAGGQLYGLESIRNNIANQVENYTRFIIVARKPITVSKQVPSKTSFVITIQNKPGSLVQALTLLGQHEINMIKLESRPIIGNPWEEMFYIDASAHQESDNMQQALKELQEQSKSLNILGCYPSENIENTQLKLEPLI